MDRIHPTQQDEALRQARDDYAQAEALRRLQSARDDVLLNGHPRTPETETR